MVKKIRVTQPSFEKKDVEVAMNLVKDTWLTQGKQVFHFENEFAEYVNRKHAVAVNSGSSANYLMLAAAKELGIININDKIVTPALSWITTIAPLYQLGFTPVFLDVTLNHENFLTIDSEKLECTDADVIYPIYFLGFPIHQKIKKRARLLFSDCCNTLLKNNHGLAQTYSFFVSHHITTGEGGMITTDDDELAQVLRSLREYGNKCKSRCSSTICRHVLDPEYMCPDRHWRFEFDYLGYNMKMLDPMAAIGREQLKKADYFLRRRRENAKLLLKGLKKFESNGILMPEYNASAHWFTFPILASTHKQKEMLTRYLDEQNIETRPILGGNMIHQDALKDKAVILPSTVENATRTASTGFMIGCHPSIEKEEIHYVIECFEQYFEK